MGKNYMTASEFAEKRNIPYQTVVRWARKRMIPGVKVTQFGKAKFYMIPDDAVITFEQPKRGRPKKAAKKRAKKEGAAK
jgi:hypothetical protein